MNDERGWFRWLGVVLLALALCACDRGDPQGAGGGDGIATATLWHSYGGRNREVLEELVQRFNDTHSTYRVEATFQGDYFESLAKLRAGLVSGELPTCTPGVGEVLPYLWQGGAREDRTRGAEGSAPLDTGELIPALTQDGYFDYAGQEVPLFALPFNRSTPIVYYNRDLFEARGLTPPTTWEELRSVASALTERDADGRVTRWGFEVPVDWWFWIALLYQSGGSILSGELDQPSFADQAGQDALQLLVDMANTVMRPPPGRDYSAWEVTNNDFLAGNAAMIWTSTAFLSYLTDNADFSVGCAPLPGRSQRGVPTGGTFFVLLADADEAEKEAAWAFTRWMMQPRQTAFYSRSTGYMPVHRAALELPEMVELYERDPNYRVALDQLEHAVPFPFSPGLFTIQREHIQPRLERPVLGLESVESALGAARSEAEETLR